MRGKWQLSKQGIFYNTTFWLPKNVQQFTQQYNFVFRLAEKTTNVVQHFLSFSGEMHRYGSMRYPKFEIRKFGADPS